MYNISIGFKNKVSIFALNSFRQNSKVPYTPKWNHDTEYSIYDRTESSLHGIKNRWWGSVHAAETKSRQNINLIQSDERHFTALRERDSRLSKFDAFCCRDSVARRAAHKYVDGYYSRLAVVRKRSENFRGTDINTVVMRLRPSETTQCNTFESGANFVWCNTRTFVWKTIKEPMESERGERKVSLLAQFLGGDAGSDIGSLTRFLVAKPCRITTFDRAHLRNTAQRAYWSTYLADFKSDISEKPERKRARWAKKKYDENVKWLYHDPSLIIDLEI